MLVLSKLRKTFYLTNSTADSQFLRLVNRIVQDNIGNEQFSVVDLARQAGLSRSMLHIKLKKLTGKSASDLITETRITKARELLEKEEANVSEIAYMVGFSDPSYFSKVFRKYNKMRPGDVRKRLTTGELRQGTVNGEIGAAKIRLPSGPFRKIALWTLAGCILLILVYYFFSGDERSAERSVAVLPLQNLTGDPDNSFIVDGIHDALIGELGRIESLRVISRTSTLRYRDSNDLLPVIAKDLGVNTIIEGSVMEAADSMKLLIQVIDIFPKEDHVLVDEYKDAIHNVLTLQRSAAKDIARNIGIKLSEKEKDLLNRSRKVNPETYRNYLRGMYHINQGSPDSFQEGIRFMLKAIRSDPGEPLAYAGLALGYAIQGHGMVMPEGSFSSAVAAAERALSIDPTLSEAYTAMAMINTYVEWEWLKAKEDFEKALATNPSNAVAHSHLAFYYILFNEREKAFHHMNMAAALEPFAAFHQASLAWFNYNSGNYDRAEAYARKALELQENIPYGNLVLGWTYIRKQKYREALALHERLPLYADYYKMLIGYTYLKSGQREQAMSLLDNMESDAGTKFVNPVFRGILAGMLGLNDRAFELLNEACDQKIFPITYLKVYPGIEGLKADPRYNLILQKMNLPV